MSDAQPSPKLRWRDRFNRALGGGRTPETTANARSDVPDLVDSREGRQGPMRVQWRSKDGGAGEMHLVELDVRAGEIAPGVRLLPTGRKLEAVGESNYVDALCEVVRDHGGQRKVLAQLVLEPDNQFDSSAVAVCIDRKRVGYLSRDDAAGAHAKLRELVNNHDALLVRAFLRGGPTEDGVLRFGVTIDTPKPGAKFGW